MQFSGLFFYDPATFKLCGSAPFFQKTQSVTLFHNLLIFRFLSHSNFTHENGVLRTKSVTLECKNFKIRIYNIVPFLLQNKQFSSFPNTKKGNLAFALMQSPHSILYEEQQGS